MAMPHWYRKPTVERRVGRPMRAYEILQEMARPNGPLDFKESPQNKTERLSTHPR